MGMRQTDRPMEKNGQNSKIHISEIYSNVNYLEKQIIIE